MKVLQLKHFRLPGAVLLGALLLFRNTAPAQAVSSDEANAAALQLMNEGKLPEAAGAFEEVIRKYPTSTLVFDAQFRLATLYYLLGDYEKARGTVQKILAPPAPAEIIELGYGLLPQVLAAKASKEKDEDARKTGFEAAIKEYDAFLQKYPSSTQVEAITYGRALSCFQIGKYEEASESLRSNLKQFPKSETIQESQFLLALSLMMQGGKLAEENPGVSNAKTDAAFDEAERLLRQIVTHRQDLALLNNAQFQLGELFLNRAIFAPQENREELFAKGLQAYRALMPKEKTIAAQEARIKQVKDRRLAALQAKNLKEMNALESLLEHEITKLAAVKAKGDLSISAQIKVGQLFYHKDAFDEARAVFRQMQPFAEDEEQKKTLLYYLTLSYAQQSHKFPSEVRQALVDKAVERYNEFQKDYKGDPLAESLPYSIGSLFLAKDPAKALEYYRESVQLYPKGRLLNDTLIAQANACIQLKQFDKARATFQEFLKGNTKRDLAAAAESGIANILKDTGKLDEALAQYKKVVATYPETLQAENAAFWVAQINLQTGKQDEAVGDFTAFLKDHPKSELCSSAKYSLAQAYARKNDATTALRLFKEIPVEFPRSDAAPYAYFEQCNLLIGPENAEARNTLMKEFIERYPGHDKIYFAYNAIAQDHLSNARLPDAIAQYAEMAEKYPDDPQRSAALLNLAMLWNQQANNIGRYFALPESQRADWAKAVDNSMAAGVKLLNDFPESQHVPLALQYLLADQKLLAGARLETEEDITKYFLNLAATFESKPQAKSKILFTLAAYTYEKDKAKALEWMTNAYNPQLVFAAADIDLFGSALLEQGKFDEAAKVYQKLASDYPNPDPEHPEKASLQTQDAQAIAMFGIAKAQQSQGQTAAAVEKFELFKKLYPHSAPAKILEANYCIAVAAHEAKKDDTAIPLLIQIYRTPAAAVDLRAKSMLLHAKIQESKNEILPAIDQFLKIAMFYESVSAVAAEGLWRGGQLLEKQAATLPATSQNSKDVTKTTQLKKAVKAYNDLLAKYPSSEFAKDAKARLVVLEPAAK